MLANVRLHCLKKQQQQKNVTFSPWGANLIRFAPQMRVYSDIGQMWPSLTYQPSTPQEHSNFKMFKYIINYYEISVFLFLIYS